MGEAGYVTLQSKFENLKRKSDQDPREYAYALLEIAEVAWPGHGYFQAVQKFRLTCSPYPTVLQHIHQVTNGVPEPNLDTMIVEATKHEQSLKHTAQAKKTAPSVLALTTPETWGEN